MIAERLLSGDVPQVTWSKRPGTLDAGRALERCPVIYQNEFHDGSRPLSHARGFFDVLARFSTDAAALRQWAKHLKPQ
jgi:hypothetical protein